MTTYKLNSVCNFIIFLDSPLSIGEKLKLLGVTTIIVRLQHR